MPLPTLSRSGRSWRALPVIGALCLVAHAGAWPAQAAEPASSPLERQVKAAYLYKFTGYIQWPVAMHARPDMPFTIGVAGDDEMAAELRALVRGRTVEGHPIEVRQVDPDAVPDGLHMLFVARGHTEAAERLAALVPPPPMLVITESPGGLRRGGMINFVLSEGRVRFEISLPAAERAGLSLSSRLLAVAQTVTRNP